MSAPLIDPSPSSISSSGHVDGLGRRSLTFDRETGAMLERLHLRPELAAFEAAIRARVDQLASFDDERFARPGSVERDSGSGDLTVLSEFVAGSRLSDLIETAEEAGVVPGVDVALGFLLEGLPAIGCFHAATGFSHGLIAPPRVVLTPAGQVVFLDPAFGSVVERLGLSRRRLWVELGVAAHPSGAIRLDITADMAQLALGAVMLVVGRRLQPDEYPDSIPRLLMEVVEVAQIRGSSLFATSLQRLLQRSLPLPGSRPFASADEFANEVRLLLRREIGADVCRRALMSFTEQMDADATGFGDGAEGTSLPLDLPLRSDDVLDLDSLSMEALDSIEVLDIEGDETELQHEAAGQPDGEEEFEEILLDPPVADPAAAAPLRGESEPAPVKEAEDPWSFDRGAADRALEESSSGVSTTTPPEPAAVPASSAPASAAEPAPAPAELALADAADAPVAAQTPLALVAATAPDPAADRAASPQETPADAPSSESSETPGEGDADAPGPAPGWFSPRRKKRQYKSARARKDKLRSAAAASNPPPLPAPPAPPARPPSGWLVNPDRAAAFAPPVVDPALGPDGPPAPVSAPTTSPAPVVQPPILQPPVVQPPVAAPPRPAIPMPVYGAPTAAPPITPPARPAPAAPIALKPVAPSGAKLKIKADPPSGFAPPRTSPITAVPTVHRGPMFNQEPPRGFPVRMALAALLLVGIAIVVGRAYLPTRAEVPDDDAPAADSRPVDPPAVVVMPKIETGHITIETQPTGARVLLDGKPVGQSPLKLADVPVGRHTLTFVSPAGEVSRIVRVAAGQTESVDVSIFSGWVAVFAPIVLDVAVKGRSIGTTEQERLMLPPGRHDLTLTNRDFGYKTTQQVDIVPGEVRSITVDPRGAVNFNAIPWAEVWLDGKKLGETPLANARVPLGTREFIFRHPELGERTLTALVRADEAVALGVDFTKPQ